MPLLPFCLQTTQLLCLFFTSLCQAINLGPDEGPATAVCVIGASTFGFMEGRPREGVTASGRLGWATARRAKNDSAPNGSESPKIFCNYPISA
jgi:hypothetical protein